MQQRQKEHMVETLQYCCYGIFSKIKNALTEYGKIMLQAFPVCDKHEQEIGLKWIKSTVF